MPAREPVPPPIGEMTMASHILQHAMEEIEAAWRTGDGISLEQYYEKNPALGSVENAPAILVYHEYWLRQQYGDAPPLATYQARFPHLYAVLSEMVKQNAPQGANKPASEDILAESALSPVQQTKAVAVSSIKLVEGYRILSLLGSGSYADVWRGEAPGGIAVAIKILRHPLDAEEAQRELQALELTKNLKHPFLLQTHSFWVQDNRLHIVMDLADGSLRKRLKECKQLNQSALPADELLVYMYESAEALDFLRKNRVYHRDVKPDNVLLIEGHAKVADFGLARTVSSQSQRLMEASYAGTPLYMAPEVFRNKVSPNTDQYSLAATYYELRVGKSLFHCGNLHQLILDHMERPPNLSALPPAEAEVLTRALAKEPNQRYPNCSAFVAALQAAVLPSSASKTDNDPTKKIFRRGSSVRTHPLESTDPNLQRELRWARRRRMAIIMCIALGLVLVAAVAGILLLFNKGSGDYSSRPDIAVSPNSTVASSLPTTPEPPLVYLPAGWEKAAEAKVSPHLFNGRKVYDSVVMIKSGIKVPLRYIPQEKPDQIAPFYIMETKVWNDLYAKFADAQPDVAKSSKWKEGWAASTTQYPGGKLSGDWPVVNISCAEAHAFANWLGGRLPSTSEWDRAAGWYKGGRGPIQGPTDAIPTSEEVAYNRLERGPLPVGKATRDVSPWGCRDMAANGLEWTRNIRFGAAESEVLDETPPKDTRMLVRGRSFGEVKPPIFADYEAYLREERTKGAGENFFGSRYDLSFRVVIETLP